MPLKPLRPHIGNQSQNTKTTPNLVLVPHKRTPIRLKRSPINMGYDQRGMQHRGESEMDLITKLRLQLYKTP